MSSPKSEILKRRSGLLTMALGLVSILLFPAVGSALVPVLLGLLLVFVSLTPLAPESRSFVVARGLTVLTGLAAVAYAVASELTTHSILIVLSLGLVWFLLVGLHDYCHTRGADSLARRTRWIRWGMVVGGAAAAILHRVGKLEGPWGATAGLLVMGGALVWIWTVLQCRRLLTTPTTTPSS